MNALNLLKLKKKGKVHPEVAAKIRRAKESLPELNRKLNAIHQKYQGDTK